MKKINLQIAAIILTAIFVAHPAAAQFKIKIPKIPKIPRSVEIQTEQSAPTETKKEASADNQSSSQSSSAAASATSSTADDEMDFRLGFFLDEIAKVQTSVDVYDPNEHLYPVSAAQAEWLLRAISLAEREKWGKQWLKKPNEKKKFADALDRLAASAAKKIPAYKADLKTYIVRSPAEEKMIKGALPALADYKIYSLGLAQRTWLISKNDYGLITSRYKHGAVYLDDQKDDHPYCYLAYVNIIQDYAGGGTYGAAYAQFIRREVVGCPAAK